MNDAPCDPARPTWVRYQVLAAVCVLAVISYIHRVGFAVVLPDIGKTLSLNNEQTSWLAAAFLFAYGAFEIPWGTMADRFGARHLLPCLVLAWSLALGATGLVLIWPVTLVPALPFILLLVLRFVFGMLQAGTFPTLSRLLADWVPRRERAFSQGCIWMCTRLGGWMVPLFLQGLMALFHGHWQTPLWILSGLGAIWAVFFWTWFRNRPEDMAAVNDAEKRFIAHGRVPQAPHHGIPWRLMLRSRSVWCLCLMYGCAGFAGNFYVTLLPNWLKVQRHLSDDDKDLLSSLPFLGGAVACVASGWLSDWLIRRLGNRRWGRSLNGAVGMFIAAAGWLWVAHVQEKWLLALVLCVIFFCNDMVLGPAWASCADIGERHAGTLGGAMNMIGNILGAAGNLLVGVLVEGHEAVMFGMFAAAYLLGSVCWLGVDVTHPLAVEEHAALLAPPGATENSPGR